MEAPAQYAHANRITTARRPTSAPPLLSVVVDCEEGFDWATPLHGTPYDLHATTGLTRLAERARRLGVQLTCMATYPLVTDDQAWRTLDAILTSGDAVLGAHLHPWVTPPFGEPSTIANSFQGNLKPAQEAAKIGTMVQVIKARTGQAPTIFKAGRSGFGPATATALIDHGFTTDLSFMPGFTYARQGGPNYLFEQPEPFFFQAAAPHPPHPPHRMLLEIPDTGAFLGLARRLGPHLHPKLDTPALRRLRLPGILARLRLLDRVPLTPEGVTQAEAQALTLALHNDGHRIFQLSFHSTSLAPGGTSYVPDEAAVTRLLDWLDDYVAFFRARLRGTVVTPPEILAALTPSAR